MKKLTKKQRRLLAETRDEELLAAFPDRTRKWLRAERKKAQEEFADELAQETTAEKHLRTYVELVEQLGRVPTDSELRPVLTKGVVDSAFNSFAEMDRLAREKYPDKFADVRIDTVRSQTVPEAKVYVLTTAVSGAEVNKPFLEALRSYCAHRGAELVIMTCADPAMNRATRQNYESIDAELAGETVLGADIRLNSNLLVRTMKVSAKMINPTTGLRRLGNSEGSSILASPKQIMSVVPTIGEYPHVVMTTGAVTVPDYTTESYWSRRTAYLAEHDHVCGALVVEILDDRRFNFRQLQAGQAGSVVDLGTRYFASGRKPKFEGVEALIFGDLHAEEEEPEHKAVRMRMVKELAPKRVYVHDVLDCGPITHHDQGKYITRATRGHTDLLIHLDAARQELVDLAEFTEVYVCRSNHDEALDRYLDEMRYKNDPNNFEIAHTLAWVKLQGKNPFAEFCKDLKNVHFLKRDEPSRVEGIECGQHGDRGPNGSRGTISNLEVAYGAAVVGHSHEPAILRKVWRVGCSCRLRQGYNSGPSGWMNSHVVISKGGMRQLINIIEGKYRVKY